MDVWALARKRLTGIQTSRKTKEIVKTKEKKMQTDGESFRVEL